MSFVTIAGGHLYNRRPYTAFLFLFFAVALQSLVDGFVPLLTPQLGTATPGSALGLMAWLKAGFLLLVAAASAFCAFADARASRESESDNRRTAASIAGAMVGLRLAASAVVTVVTIIRFNAG